MLYLDRDNSAKFIAIRQKLVEAMITEFGDRVSTTKCEIVAEEIMQRFDMSMSS